MARQKIIAKAVRTETTVLKETRKEHRYRTVERRSILVETVTGYRLACGHVINGAHGHGKQSAECWFCESTTTPHPIWVAQQAAFVDVPDDAGDQ